MILRSRILPAASALLVATFGCARPSQIDPVTPTLDVILRGGTILDGTGAPRFRADVGVLNGRILHLGDLSGQRAAVQLDVTGLMVAPGFINLHSHASPTALATAANMLTQGVTTELLNSDGGGPLDMHIQLSGLGRTGALAVNVGAYAPFNTIWSRVMGNAERRATVDDVNTMRTLLTESLQRGAWGVSAGLDYKPAYYAQVDEVVRVVEAARDWRTNFTNHDRLTPETGFSSRVGMLETMEIGGRTGLIPVITHMKVQGREQGSAPAFLETMKSATFTAADVYPYLAGQTSLGALLIPGWAQEGGRTEMLKRFADPSLRARIVAEADEAMRARFGGPEGVYLPAARRELVDYMREFGVSSGGEAVIRILETQSPSAILRFGSEPDLVRIMQHPTASIACDCGATSGTGSHPRGFGTYPRVLGRYVREQQLLTWEDAIRKMSGLPAATIGLSDRGLLAAGMVADIVVFDSATVIDRATYENPGAFSEGIVHVLVNGRIALRDGKPTGERTGQALFRTANQPSRPLRVDHSRSVSVNGTVQGWDIALDITQAPGVRSATGSLTVRGGDGNRIVAREFGVLQTAERWATISGSAVIQPGRAERAFTVIVDLGDPFAKPGGSVVVEVDGLQPISGPAPATSSVKN